MLPQGVLSIPSGDGRGGRDGAVRRRRQFVCSGGKISNAQSFAEFLSTSRAAHFNRESHRLRRQHYNERARQFNTSIAEFPRNRVAGAFGFSVAQLFAAEAADRENVKVQV